MNSLAALSRALSNKRPALSRQASRRDVGVTADLASYELPATAHHDSTITAKEPESQAVEQAEDLLIRRESESGGEVDESPASAYPSPPPTPDPAEASVMPSAHPTLRRKLSKKQTAAVERAARTLPVRLAVNLYRLIRRVLALMGIRIAEPPSLEPQIELPPEKTSDEPPSYEEVVQRAVPLPTKASNWSILPFRKRQDSPQISPAVSRRGSDQTVKVPSQGASLLVILDGNLCFEQCAALAVLNRRKTLVLDLDETLIHSTSRIGGLPSTGGRWGGSGLKVRVVEVVLEGRSVVYHVYKRPWVDQFLRKVATWYSVVIFTASVQEYADPVIDWLDAGTGIIEGRHFRESCIYQNGSYIKDLTVLGPDTDLSRVCLIDNSPASFAKNQANGIPIEGFISDPNDQALLDLLPLLDSLRFTQDVRRVLGLRAFSPFAGKV